MKKSIIVKLVLAGAAMYGAYKLYKAVDENEKKKAAALKKHREEVLEEIDGELNEAEMWNKEIKDLTLNNPNLKPSDRAYAYNLLKEKYDAILEAKTIADIDISRKEFEQFHSILMTVKDPETFETLFKIEADKQAQIEKLRQEKAERDAEIEKYKQISNVIEKIGTKVVCNLVQ